MKDDTNKLLDEILTILCNFTGNTLSHSDLRDRLKDLEKDDYIALIDILRRDGYIEDVEMDPAIRLVNGYKITRSGRNFISSSGYHAEAKASNRVRIFRILVASSTILIALLSLLTFYLNFLHRHVKNWFSC